LEAIQIVVYHLISLVVGGPFQSIDRVYFCIYREEVQLELLFEVSPGLDRENASVHFLTKYIFRPLGSVTAFEEHESLENLFLLIMELLRG